MTETPDGPHRGPAGARAGALRATPTPARARSTRRPSATLLSGVPMNWMTRWPGASRSSSTERAGRRRSPTSTATTYADLCLGDTGAMCGHSPRRPVAGDPRAARARDHDDAAERGRRARSASRCADASACATGSSRSRPPTPTASSSGSAARSPGGRRSSSTTTATTASVDETVVTLGDGRARRAALRQRRPAGRSRRDDPGGRDQRPRGARARARRRRRRLRAGRAGADQHRHRPARPRLPRGAAPAHPRARDAAGDRRDAHAQLRPRRLHRAPTASSRTRSTIGKPIAGGIPTGAYGLTRRARRAGPRAERLGRGRRRRRRRHAGRQRALARRGPGDPRRGPDRRGLRADDRAGRALRGGRQRGDRPLRARLERRPARLPGRVHVLARAAAQRRRGGRGDRRPARRADAPLHAQPRDPVHPVPHDGPDVPGDHRGAGRRATRTAFEEIAAELAA